MSTAIKFTYEDYLELPEDRRYEIIDGELYMVPAPVPYHQKVSRNLLFLLHAHLIEHDLGEVLPAPCDLLLSEFDVVQPDLIFIAKDKLSIIKDKNIQGSPSLVVEVLSPASEKRDKGAKLKLYSSSGIQEYWIVDPQEKTIEVFQLTKGGYQKIALYQENDSLRSDLFPDLTISLLNVF